VATGSMELVRVLIAADLAALAAAIPAVGEIHPP
jgi:hypothetical protein